MSTSEQRVAEILWRCGTKQSVMPPTTLYEEGWMLRLIVDWFARHPPQSHPLGFLPDSSWYSEALLHTQFKADMRGDNRAESWTHADGAIGDFTIGGTGSGDLVLKEKARQFVIIEAKMFSSLSSGTKNAPGFNQAARNVACMAEALSQVSHNPANVTSLGFVVCAPKEQIDLGIFQPLIDKDHIRQTVKNRVAMYSGDKDKDAWFSNWFEPTLNKITISLLDWKGIIDDIEKQSADEGSQLQDFYAKCLKYNRRRKFEPTPETEITPVQEITSAHK